MSNYFINNYKKNTQAGAKKESDFLPAAGAQSENEKVVKPFVFEKIERTPFPPKDVEKEGSGGDNKNEHLPHIGEPRNSFPKVVYENSTFCHFLNSVGLDKACEIMKILSAPKLRRLRNRCCRLLQLVQKILRLLKSNLVHCLLTILILW